MKLIAQNLNDSKTYSNKKIKLTYITQEQYDNLRKAHPEQAQYMGYINLEKDGQTQGDTKGDNVYHLMVDSKSYYYNVVKDYPEDLKGFIRVKIEKTLNDKDDENYPDYAYLGIKFKKIHMLPIVIGVIALFVAIFLVAMFTMKPDNPPSTEVTDEDNGLNPPTVEHIKMPGYTNMTIDEDSSMVQLVNPNSDKVEVVYSIYENDNLVYESEKLQPKEKLNLDLKDKLTSGAHELTFNITSYDIETGELCNGVTQNVEVYVK